MTYFDVLMLNFGDSALNSSIDERVAAIPGAKLSIGD